MTKQAPRGQSSGVKSIATKWYTIGERSPTLCPLLVEREKPLSIPVVLVRLFFSSPLVLLSIVLLIVYTSYMIKSELSILNNQLYALGV